MRKTAASTDQQKIEFIISHERLIRNCPPEGLDDLALALARKMKALGLHSEKTIVQDVATGIRTRIRRLGWLKKPNK